MDREKVIEKNEMMATEMIITEIRTTNTGNEKIMNIELITEVPTIATPEVITDVDEEMKEPEIAMVVEMEMEMEMETVVEMAEEMEMAEEEAMAKEVKTIL